MADESVPLLWGGFDITADIDTDRDGADGVVFALGDWFGGYALYLVGGQRPLHLRPGRRRARADDGGAPSPAGRHEITVSYVVGEGGAPGRMVLSVDGAEVDETAVEGMLPLAVQHGGAGLRLGWDSGFPVSSRYAPPAPFEGTVHERPGGHARFACDPIPPTRSAPPCTPTEPARPAAQLRLGRRARACARCSRVWRAATGARSAVGEHQAAGGPEGGRAVELLVAEGPQHRFEQGAALPRGAPPSRPA